MDGDPQMYGDVLTHHDPLGITADVNDTTHPYQGTRDIPIYSYIVRLVGRNRREMRENGSGYIALEIFEDRCSGNFCRLTPHQNVDTLDYYLCVRPRLPSSHSA
jgi:hypothetical protein